MGGGVQGGRAKGWWGLRILGIRGGGGSRGGRDLVVVGI